MAVCKDLTGEKFGYLTVISREQNTSSGRARWKCLCKCGKYTIVPTYRLNSGECKSCGCKKFESHNKVHGMKKTDIYNKWLSMKQRCFDKNHKTYKKYGAVGITVCEDWKNNFIAFRNWSYKNGYREGLSIDRIDNAKGYSPDNCRWVEWKEQANNRTTNILFTYNGQTKNLKQWCNIYGKNYNTVYCRIKICGWDFEKAMFTPKLK